MLPVPQQHSSALQGALGLQGCLEVMWGHSQRGGQSCWAQQTLAELSGLLLTLDLCTGRSHPLILTAPGHSPSFVCSGGPGQGCDSVKHGCETQQWLCQPPGLPGKFCSLVWSLGS